MIFIQGARQSVYTGHGSMNVRAFAFSHDGRFVLSSSNENDLKLWESKTGKEVRTFKGQTSEIKAIDFSPDGSFVLSGSRSGVQLWDLTKGSLSHFFSGEAIESVAFSPDGRLVLAGTRRKTLRLWEAETGRELRTISGHSHFITSAVFSSDGRYLLSAEALDCVIKLWDTQTGKEVRSFKWDGGFRGRRIVDFSSDGNYALSGDKKGVQLWDLSADI